MVLVSCDHYEARAQDPQERYHVVVVGTGDRCVRQVSWNGVMAKGIAIMGLSAGTSTSCTENNDGRCLKILFIDILSLESVVPFQAFQVHLTLPPNPQVSIVVPRGRGVWQCHVMSNVHHCHQPYRLPTWRNTSISTDQLFHPD